MDAGLPLQLKGFPTDSHPLSLLRTTQGSSRNSYQMTLLIQPLISIMATKEEEAFFFSSRLYVDFIPPHPQMRGNKSAKKDNGQEELRRTKWSLGIQQFCCQDPTLGKAAQKDFRHPIGKETLNQRGEHSGSGVSSKIPQPLCESGLDSLCSKSTDGSNCDRFLSKCYTNTRVLKVRGNIGDVQHISKVI